MKSKCHDKLKKGHPLRLFPLETPKPASGLLDGATRVHVLGGGGWSFRAASCNELPETIDLLTVTVLAKQGALRHRLFFDLLANCTRLSALYSGLCVAVGHLGFQVAVVTMLRAVARQQPPLLTRRELAAAGLLETLLSKVQRLTRCGGAAA